MFASFYLVISVMTQDKNAQNHAQVYAFVYAGVILRHHAANLLNEIFPRLSVLGWTIIADLMRPHRPVCACSPMWLMQ